MTNPGTGADDAPQPTDSDSGPPWTGGRAVTPPPYAGPPGSAPPYPSAPGPTPGHSGGPLPWRTGPDDTTWATLAHIGGIFFSFVPPLIVLLTKGQQSGFVRDQAVEALNFQITVAIGYVVSAILLLVLVGLLLLAVVGIGALVLGILAAVAAGRGQAYRYPVNIRLVR